MTKLSDRDRSVGKRSPPRLPGFAPQGKPTSLYEMEVNHRMKIACTEKVFRPKVIILTGTVGSVHGQSVSDGRINQLKHRVVVSGLVRRAKSATHTSQTVTMHQLRARYRIPVVWRTDTRLVRFFLVVGDRLVQTAGCDFMKRIADAFGIQGNFSHVSVTTENDDGRYVLRSQQLD